MKDRPNQHGQAFSRRIGAQRRAARALVAGYIHELSNRHGAPSRPRSGGNQATRGRERHDG